MVRDPDVKHQLARLNRQAWSVYRRLGARRARRDESTRKIVAAVQWQADHFEEIPVVIVACLHGRAPRASVRRARPRPSTARPSPRSRTCSSPPGPPALAPPSRPFPSGPPPWPAARSDFPLASPRWRWSLSAGPGDSYGPTTRRAGGRSGTSRPLRESSVPVDCCVPHLHTPGLRLRHHVGHMQRHRRRRIGRLPSNRSLVSRKVGDTWREKDEPAGSAKRVS